MHAAQASTASGAIPAASRLLSSGQGRQPIAWDTDVHRNGYERSNQGPAVGARWIVPSTFPFAEVLQ